MWNVSVLRQHVCVCVGVKICPDGGPTVQPWGPPVISHKPHAHAHLCTMSVAPIWAASARWWSLIGVRNRDGRMDHALLLPAAAFRPSNRAVVAR